MEGRGDRKREKGGGSIVVVSLRDEEISRSLLIAIAFDVDVVFVCPLMFVVVHFGGGGGDGARQLNLSLPLR